MKDSSKRTNKRFFPSKKISFLLLLSFFDPLAILFQSILFLSFLSVFRSDLLVLQSVTFTQLDLLLFFFSSSSAEKDKFYRNVFYIAFTGYYRVFRKNVLLPHQYTAWPLRKWSVIIAVSVHSED